MSRPLATSKFARTTDDTMGKITGFMEIERRDRPYVPVAERVKVYKEFVRPLPDDEMSRQSARCSRHAP